MSITISRTDLARNTRAIVDQVRQGQTIVVQSYGQDQAVLLGAMDYRILKALADYAVKTTPEGNGDVFDDALRAYMDEHISLAKAAEVLGISRFELMQRFEQLDIPLRLGSATADEAQEEVLAADEGRTTGG